MRYPDEILAVEMSSYCNLRCPMCTQCQVDYDKKGFMDIRLWEKLIGEFAAAGVKYEKFLPFGLGESLLHPKAYEMLAYMFDKNKDRTIFGHIILHTNALLMDERISDLMLKYQYQIGALHFSLDAATQETYSKVRPGAELSRAVMNIVYFLKHRSQIPPKVVLQFIVMKRNFNEANNFLKFWSEVLTGLGLGFQVNYDWQPEMLRDTIFFKRENTWNPADLGQSEELHKKVAFGLGLITEIPKGRLLMSDEFVK